MHHVYDEKYDLNMTAYAQAAEKATGKIFVLLNNDTEIIEADWLTELIMQVTRPEVGVAGALLLFGNETIQHAGIHPGIG